MQISNNSQVFIARHVHGAEVRFGKLTPRDRAGVLRRLKAERKQKLVDNLQTAGIASEQILVELQAFDDRLWGQSRWIEYLNTVEGQEAVVRLAFAKCSSGDPDQSLDTIEVTDGSLLPLAAELCNLRLTPIPSTPQETGQERAAHPTDPPESAD